jgi:hypothetical protein
MDAPVRNHAHSPEPLDPAVCRSIRDAQKHTPNRVWYFTKALHKDKLGVNGTGLCGASVVAQFQLFAAQGMLYSLALMYSPLLNRCDEMA